MNILRRHLNWTVVLATIATRVVAGFLYGQMMIQYPGLSGAFQSASQTGWLMEDIYFIILLVIGFAVWGWALRQKNRSLGWMPLFLVPLGWIVFLRLENRTIKRKKA